MRERTGFICNNILYMQDVTRIGNSNGRKWSSQTFDTSRPKPNLDARKPIVVEHSMHNPGRSLIFDFIMLWSVQKPCRPRRSIYATSCVGCLFCSSFCAFLRGSVYTRYVMIPTLFPMFINSDTELQISTFSVTCC